MSSKKIEVAIAGNPNSGKTTIFNNLTGARHRVGNWAGVTIEKKEGVVSYKNIDITFVDLPGTYSLTAYSIEELIARKFIVEEFPDVVINIIDASNLERNLYLTMQLIELGANLIFVLNMVDHAENLGIFIDDKKFVELSGVPVIKTVGNKNKGMNEILEEVIKAAERGRKVSRMRPTYGDEVEEEIKKIQNIVCKNKEETFQARHTGIKLLENDKEVLEKVKSNPGKDEILNQVSASCKHLEGIYEDDIEIIMADYRYGFIHGLCKEILHKSIKEKIILSDKIDMFLTNRFLGIPIFLGIMLLMFQTTFTLGDIPGGWIESFFDLLSSSAQIVLPGGLLKSLFVDGIIPGIGGILVFLPNILILFLFISFFEDTGYMARAAFIMDRIMHSIGLHGKSFIPLIMGFGCNVPAIMATRTLESQRDRILSILINPYISCSARLPIYILFAGAFFSENAGNVIFSLYILGLFVSIFSGMLFNKLLFKKESAPFVMELPPYRLPSLKSTAIHMWEKSRVFVKKIWKVVMIGSILLWFLGNFPRNVHFSKNYDKEIKRIENTLKDNDPSLSIKRKEISTLRNQKNAEYQEKTYIGRLGKFIEPVFEPLGFNWKNSVALVSGFIAKEIVVSTHGILFKIGEGIEKGENAGLIEALRHSHMNPLSAYGFMVFTLLYTPCLATLGIIKKETGSWKWAAFSVFYSLSLAWCLAFLVVKVGTFFAL